MHSDVARSKSVSFASGSSDSQEAIDIEAEVDADRESEGFDPRIVEDAGQSYTEDIHQDKPAHVESDDCCYYAIRYEPFAVCGKHCDPRVCNRGALSISDINCALLIQVFVLHGEYPNEHLVLIMAFCLVVPFIACCLQSWKLQNVAQMCPLFTSYSGVFTTFISGISL